jgi:hypothetical protein
VAVVVSALVLSACGGSSDSEEGDSPSSMGYVSRTQVAQYKEGSPQRTILTWWMAVQFANAEGAHALYAPQDAPSVKTLVEELALASKQFSGIPTFSSVEIHGDTATAYFFVSRPESSSTPRAASINMVKVDGKWLLADDGMLAQVVERVKAS